MGWVSGRRPEAAGLNRQTFATIPIVVAELVALVVCKPGMQEPAPLGVHPKTFVSTRYGFQMSYPRHWHLKLTHAEKPSPETIIFEASDWPRAMVTLTLYSKAPDYLVDPAKYKADMKDVPYGTASWIPKFEKIGWLSGFTRTGAVVNTVGGSNETFFYDFSLPGPYYMCFRGKVWTHTYDIDAPSVLSQYMPLLRAMLESLRLVRPTNVTTEPRP